MAAYNVSRPAAAAQHLLEARPPFSPGALPSYQTRTQQMKRPTKLFPAEHSPLYNDNVHIGSQMRMLQCAMISLVHTSSLFSLPGASGKSENFLMPIHLCPLPILKKNQKKAFPRKRASQRETFASVHSPSRVHSPCLYTRNLFDPAATTTTLPLVTKHSLIRANVRISTTPFRPLSLPLRLPRRELRSPFACTGRTPPDL